AEYDFSECTPEDECLAEGSISVDGGQSWIPVELGELVDITSPNNDLRWQLRLRTGNSNVTPRVDWLSLNYTTDYDTSTVGVYTSQPEDTDTVTGCGDKIKNFTTIQWLQEVIPNTNIVFQYSIDGEDWQDAVPDGPPEPVFVVDHYVDLYTSTIDRDGYAIRYRATLSSDDPGATPILLEVRQGYGYASNGYLVSTPVVNLIYPDAYWEILEFVGYDPNNTSYNIDILHHTLAPLEEDLTSSGFDMSEQDYSINETLRLKVDLYSNPERDTTPALSMWRLGWHALYSEGLVFFIEQNGDLLTPKEYSGQEDVYVMVVDADRNESRLSPDII
ncbi:MAG: hypothetical protein GY869_28525, partial [Planctomycetes bacterium]|nr:hypothetical protein [Planctomycetota bacterium]